MAGASHHGGDAAMDPALLADRQAEWARFCQFTVYGVVGVTALLLLMKIFLV